MRLGVFLVSCFCLIPILNYAQTIPLSHGILPEVQLKYKFKNHWSFTGKVESRHNYLEKHFAKSPTINYTFQLTDFQGFIEKKLSPFSSVAAGYQFRLNNLNNNSHRYIQQWAFVQTLQRLRLAHRVRTDQTFSPNQPIELRARYRAVAELAIQGTQIDEKEWYYLLGGEFIAGLQNNAFAPDARIINTLGYFYNKRNKFEVALDWRTDRFNTPAIRHRTWLKLGWYITL